MSHDKTRKNIKNDGPQLNATPQKRKRGRPRKLRFEDCYEEINVEIAKRRHKWNLSALSWLDYDDVSQIIRIHIHKKWHLYDQKKKLSPWINRIISNQIKNLIRNNYGNYVRPCLKCAAAEGEAGCTIYEKQCSDCPLYKNWEKNKKSAYDTKIPIALENHAQEVYQLPNQSHFDMNATTDKLHKHMKSKLKANEWIAYKYLYIEYKSEDETARLMGYKTSEKNRSPGYKQIKNLKKSIITKVKKCLEDQEIDII